MTQSFIQPKGTLKPQTNIEDIQKQYAQLVSQPQAQPETKTEQDMLRQTVNDLVKSALMNPVEIPKPYKTIQDVFNANNGDRFKALGDWFNGPQFNRFAGGDLTFNPETKRMESTGTRIGREQEARLNADREKALEQQKQQLGIANDVYNAYNRMDIENMQDKRARELAEQELKFRKEENALDRGLKREQLNAMIAHQRAMEGIARERLSGGGNTKLTAAQQTAMSNISQMDTILNLIKQTPNATGFWQGINPALNKMESKNPETAANITTRAAIDKLRTEIRHTLTGAQFSPKEAREYEKFLPTNMDNPTEINQKIKGLKIMFMSDPRLLGNVGLSNTQSTNNDPMGLGL